MLVRIIHHHQVIQSPPRSTTLSNLSTANRGFGLHSPRWPDGLGRPDVICPLVAFYDIHGKSGSGLILLCRNHTAIIFYL